MRHLHYSWIQPGSLSSRIVLAAALLAVFIGSVLDMGHSPTAGINDKLQHLLAFMVLGLMAFFAMPGRDSLRFTLPLLLVYGLLIECVQWQLPWREFSLLDLASDVCGLCLAVALEKHLLRVFPRHLP